MDGHVRIGRFNERLLIHFEWGDVKLRKAQIFKPYEQIFKPIAQQITLMQMQVLPDIKISK